MGSVELATSSENLFITFSERFLLVSQSNLSDINYSDSVARNGPGDTEPTPILNFLSK